MLWVNRSPFAIPTSRSSVHALSTSLLVAVAGNMAQVVPGDELAAGEGRLVPDGSQSEVPRIDRQVGRLAGRPAAWCSR